MGMFDWFSGDTVKEDTGTVDWGTVWKDTVKSGANVLGGAVSGGMKAQEGAMAGMVAHPAAERIMKVLDVLSRKILEYVTKGDIPAAEATAKTWERARAQAEQITGLPVTGPSDDGKVAKWSHAAGEGVIGTTHVPSMAMGALANVVGEAVAEDSALGKFAISIGIPLAVGTGARTVQRSLANRHANGPVSKRYNMTKAQRTGDPEDAAEVATLERHPKTSMRMKEFYAKQGDEVYDDLNKFTKDLAGPKAKDADEGRRAAKAFTKYFDDLHKRHKDTNSANFDEVWKLAGDKRFIDITPVRNRLKELFDKYSGDLSDPVSARKATQIKGMIDKLDSYVQVPGFDVAQPQARLATVREMQNALENYGQVGYGKGGVFADVAPGSDVGDARGLVEAWKETFANARKNLTGDEQKAVGLLEKARGQFQKGIEREQNFLNAPIAKLIEKTSMTTGAENIVARFKAMTPSERAFYADILHKSGNEKAIDAMRRAYFNEALDSGRVLGAGKTAQQWDPKGFLVTMEKRMKSDPEFVKFMFPNNKDRAAFYSRIDDMKRIVDNTPIAVEPHARAAEATGEMVGLATGRPLVRPATRTAIGMIKDVFTDKDDMYDVLVNGTSRTSLGTRLVQSMADTFGGRVNKGPRNNPWVPGYGPNRVTQAVIQSPDVVDQDALLKEKKANYDNPLRPVDRIIGAASDVVEGVKKNMPAVVDPLSPDAVFGPETGGGLEDLSPDAVFGPEASSPFDDAFMDKVRQVESGGDRFALSSKKAMGPYQFNEITMREMELDDPWDEEKSRKAAKGYLEKLYERFGSVDDAVMAYNMGPTAYAEYKAGKRGLPTETENYRRKLLGR